MSQRDKERQRRGKVSRVSSYTGFPINTQQFIQPQRSAGIPMGGSSVTTGPAQFQEQPSLAKELESGINTYKSINDAYEGGGNIRKAYDKFDFGKSFDKGMDSLKGFYDDISNPFSGGSAPAGGVPANAGPDLGATTGAWYGDATGAGDTPMAAHWNPQQSQTFNRSGIADVGGNMPSQPAVGPNVNPNFLDTQPIANSGYSGLPSQGWDSPNNIGDYQFGAGQTSQAGQAANIPIGEQSFSGLMTQGQNAMKGISGLGIQQAVPGTYGAAGGLGNFAPGLSTGVKGVETGLKSAEAGIRGAEVGVKAADASAKAVTGLNAGVNATDAATKGAMGAGGVAMAGIGGALNAYDMMENGVNAGNAMGLASSAVFIGTMNAWNPVGWALLAGSAAFSIFG